MNLLPGNVISSRSNCDILKQAAVKEYWEQRLKQDFSLGGVGFKDVGHQYNAWLYKLRARHFEKAIEIIDRDSKQIRKKNQPHSNAFFSKSAKCLDIGSGTGFYIEQLIKSGFENIEGSDLTTISFDNLKHIYPRLKIHLVNLANDETSSERYDLITCMDVLFHIVEDPCYEKAISNLGKLLHTGGYLILTENFSRVKRNREHISDRTKEELFENLKTARFEILHYWSQFIFMNSPMQSSSKLLWWISNTRIKFLKKIRNTPASFFAQPFGAMLYFFERFLFFAGVKGKGTSIIVCRKLS